MNHASLSQNSCQISTRLESSLGTLKLFSLAFLFGVALLAAPSPCIANPSNKDPKAGIKSLGANPHAQAKITQLYEFYNTHEAECVQYNEQKDPSRLPFKKITSTYGQIWKAERDAHHLELMGEAAGLDLRKKFRMLRHEFRKFAAHATPMRPKVVAKLRQETPRRQRTLQQAAKAAQGGNYTQAVNALEKLGTDLQTDLFYLTSSETRPFWDPFISVLSPVDEKVQVERRKKYQGATMQVAAAKREATEKLKSEATRLPSEIAATGSASLGGDQMLDGAAAIDYLGTLWGASSAELVNHWAMACAFKDGMAVNPGAELEKEIAEIESVAILGVGSIIEAAAVNAKTEEVAGLYSRVLKAVSKLDRRMAGEASNKFQRSLAKLASKNPALAKQVQNYERAIAEAVRWREDYAYQQEKHLTQGYTDAGPRLRNKEPIEHDKRPSIYQRTPLRGERIVAPSTFAAPADWMIYDAEKLVGETVVDSDILGISPQASLAVARYDSNHYSQIKLDFPLEQHKSDLYEALLLDDSHGPLTIEAADAISALENLDYEKMGGQITGIYLESLTSRFATLPAQVHAIVPLDDTPTVESDIAPLEQTCWRLVLQPHWARHKLFTIRTPR